MSKFLDPLWCTFRKADTGSSRNDLPICHGTFRKKWDVKAASNKAHRHCCVSVIMRPSGSHNAALGYFKRPHLALGAIWVWDWDQLIFHILSLLLDFVFMVTRSARLPHNAFRNYILCTTCYVVVYVEISM